MSLIAAGGETSTTATVTNAAFFPDVKLIEFRATMRVDGTVTDDRAMHALESAMYDANSQLSGWAEERQAEGVSGIEDAPGPSWYPAGAYKRLYLRAVYSLAKANLVDRYRDFDSSSAGGKEADKLEPIAEDYRRDAAWAISDIMGTRRSTVELI